MFCTTALRKFARRLFGGISIIAITVLLISVAHRVGFGVAETAAASLATESTNIEAAATLSIREAKWDANKAELTVSGVGATPNRTLTIKDADSGVALGTASVKSNGEWTFKTTTLAVPPCRVEARTDSAMATRKVDKAPKNCGVGGPPPVQTSHAGRFNTYEGSRTCNRCHNRAREVHASVHYQWTGPTPHVVNMTVGGKLGGINDFCTYPDINFLGQLTNLQGNVVDGGCALCHVGMGAKPTADTTQSQLENIDCLICHSDAYRRKVVKLADGTFRFEPAPEKMTVPLLQAITDIQQQPTKGACVNCHAYAGGGCNNKRGDIEEAHRNPPNAAFDVHMASRDQGGAGLLCQDCHINSNHRFAGRGVDLRVTDLDVPVRCTNCHALTPHDSAKLNDHTDRVDCTSCHIPMFAKITSTDMFRDFSVAPDVNPSNHLYEPHMVRATNVVPEYRFWNGQSVFYQFGAAIQPAPNGRVLMAGPVGGITDANAKIYPFKHHLAKQAYDPVSKRILPLKMGVLFQTGNMDQAIRQGATEVGWSLPQGYLFANTERYMGIFHEVTPSNNALSCNACHEGTRVNFAALGYTPLPARDPTVAANCGSGCHGDRSDKWSASEFFQQVHRKHVDDRRINCRECHTYN